MIFGCHVTSMEKVRCGSRKVAGRPQNDDASQSNVLFSWVAARDARE